MNLMKNDENIEHIGQIVKNIGNYRQAANLAPARGRMQVNFGRKSWCNFCKIDRLFKQIAIRASDKKS